MEELTALSPLKDFISYGLMMIMMSWYTLHVVWEPFKESRTWRFGWFLWGSIVLLGATCGLAGVITFGHGMEIWTLDFQ
jgi:hypothetical protein